MGYLTEKQIQELLQSWLHELGNRLHSLSGYSQILSRKQGDPEKQARLIDKIEVGVQGTLETGEALKTFLSVWSGSNLRYSKEEVELLLNALCGKLLRGKSLKFSNFFDQSAAISREQVMQTLHKVLELQSKEGE